jgi:serine/threonine protein kinase
LNLDQNILCLDEFDDTKIMISDFGLSKFATPAELMKIACGTLCYVAPEVLKLTGYSFSVDVWSIGVIMYLLLRGRLPFDGKTKDEIIDRTLTGAPDFTHPSWKQVSPDAIHLINQLLQKDPNQRISCEKARQHPWFESIRAQKTQAAAAAAAATAPLELTPAVAGSNARHPEHLQLGLLRPIPAQHALYSPEVGGVSANVYSSHFADVPADRPNSQQSILAAAGQRP